MKPLGNRPEITLIVDSEADAEAAKLLVGVLGLVQLEVVRHREEVASSSHTLICLQSKPEGLFDFEGDVLQLGDNSNLVVGQESLGEFKRVTTYVPSALTTNSLSPVARFVHAAFWLDQRLFKASQPLSDSELALWRFVCGIAKQLGQDESVAWHTICARIAQYRVSAEPVSSNHQIPSAEVAGTFFEVLSPVTSRQVADALLNSEITLDGFVGICETISNSASIMALAVYLWLRGEEDFLDRSAKILQGDEWSFPETSFPRSVRNGSSLSYTPVTLLWLYLVSLDYEPKNVVNEEPLYIREISTRGQVPGVEPDADTVMPHLARSAWTLWLGLHRTHAKSGRQILLTRESYLSTVADLETYWLEVFRAVQRRRGRIFFRVLPWPEGKRAALTLRFDVDRKLTESQVENVVNIQSRYLSEPSGSWYFWATDPSAGRWKQVLEPLGQEVGIHALGPEDVRKAAGITHHSAPTSSYWQGDSTMVSLENFGALYGEYLGNQIPRPRSMLLPGLEKLEKRSKTLFTGPGFPLEGSTHDKSLDFFDRLLGNFRQHLSQGGHAIVITHPDLNMGHLGELLERENLDDVWISTTSEVVLRMKHLQEYESFSSRTDIGGAEIRSCSELEDVLTFIEIPESGAQILQSVSVSEKAFYIRP